SPAPRRSRWSRSAGSTWRPPTASCCCGSPRRPDRAGTARPRPPSGRAAACPHVDTRLASWTPRSGAVPARPASTAPPEGRGGPRDHVVHLRERKCVSYLPRRGDLVIFDLFDPSVSVGGQGCDRWRNGGVLSWA